MHDRRLGWQLARQFQGDDVKTYEIRSGERSVTVRDASTPQHAIIDYLRSMGCRDREMVRLGKDGVSWRGAVYKAVPVAEDRRL
jgi:hypothetical protein